jgi:hypothetical protein
MVLNCPVCVALFLIVHFFWDLCRTLKFYWAKGFQTFNCMNKQYLETSEIFLKTLFDLLFK